MADRKYKVITNTKIFLGAILALCLVFGIATLYLAKDEDTPKVMIEKSPAQPNTAVTSAEPETSHASPSKETFQEYVAEKKSSHPLDWRPRPKKFSSLLQDREPSSQEPPDLTINVTKLEPPPPAPNHLLNSSRIAIEGAGYTMFSREEILAHSRKPTGIEMGFRWVHWLNNESHGIEANLKSNVVGSAASHPLSAEVRYHRRWHLPWSPFSTVNESQISTLLGYEYFRNSGTGYFSPQYDLLKIGFALNFPVSTQMNTGGEILLGIGADQSHKYEISGHLDYFLKSRISLGIGYRMHLFEAGSSAKAPAGVGIPYREAYGEAYSVLSWHY